MQWYAALLSAALLPTALAIVLTRSRTGLVLLLAVSVGLAVATWWIFRSWRRRIAACVATGSLLCVLALGIAWQPLASRWDGIAEAENLADLSLGRAQVWQAAAGAFHDFPILGTGLGTHADIYPRYLRQAVDVQFTHAESGYLQVAEETGVIGFLLLLIAITTAASWAIKAWKRAPTCTHAFAVVCIVAGLATSVIHSLVDFPWYIPACMTLTIALLAGLRTMAFGGVKDTQQASLAPTGDRRTPIVAVATCAVVGAFIISIQLPAARAARYWDAYVREINRAGPMRTAVLGTHSGGTPDQAASDASSAAVRRSIALLQAAAQRNPHDGRLHSRLAAAFLQQFEIAQHGATNAMPIDAIRQAATLSGFGSAKELRAWLERAVPENVRWLQLAWWHTLRSLELAPLSGRTYVYAAQLGFLAEMPTGQRQACLKLAARLRPTDPNVLLAVGSELALDGNFAAAQPAWRRAFHLSAACRHQMIESFGPRLPVAQLIALFRPSLAHTRELLLYFQQAGLAGRSADAARAFLRQFERQSGANSPISPELYFQAFLLYDDSQQSERALRALQRAVRDAPERYAWRLRLGRYCLQCGRYRSAANQLQQCVARRPLDEALRRDLQRARGLR